MRAISYSDQRSGMCGGPSGIVGAVLGHGAQLCEPWPNAPATPWLRDGECQPGWAAHRLRLLGIDVALWRCS